MHLLPVDVLELLIKLPKAVALGAGVEGIIERMLPTQANVTSDTSYCAFPSVNSAETAVK
jgi:hypothetical protein